MTEAFIEIPGSRLFYREAGAGTPLLFLHGGWGYEVYPFDHQIAAFQHQFRVLIPDRTGYGRSPGIEKLPPDFHQRAASETLSFLNALEIDQAILWGHSDGAVIAALCGLIAPHRIRALILEAIHYQSAKHRSLDWMRSVQRDPNLIGDRARTAMIRDHGEEWRGVVERNAAAWIEIARVGGPDMYGGKLSELKPPVLIIVGEKDQRTEPGDPEKLRQALPGAEFQIIPEAGHSPHSGPNSAAECTRVAKKFLDSLPG